MTDVPALLERLATHSRERPANVALSFWSRGTMDGMSWVDVYEGTARVGRRLRGLGVGAGDVALIAAADPRQQVLGLLGAMACGGVPALLPSLSSRAATAELRTTVRSLRSSPEGGGAKLIVASSELADVAADLGSEGNVVLLDNEALALEDASDLF